VWPSRALFRPVRLEPTPKSPRHWDCLEEPGR
jgi:hypothetical protein